jgi:large subunit ribosomal protein L32e
MTEKQTLEKALKLREKIKKKKPDFHRQESWRYKRLKTTWRRPRGLDNKMRRKIKGWPPTVEAGYRGPKITRGLHPSGYKEVLVYNVEDLKKIKSKTQAIRIGHTVGKRKRANIFVEARKLRIHILNFKEASKVIEEEQTDEKKESSKEETEKLEKPKLKRKDTKKQKKRVRKEKQ